MRDDIVFLDTNILLRHYLQDIPDQSPRASAFMRRVGSGDQSVETSLIVLFETVFTLTRTYKRSKPLIRDALTALLDLPNFVVPDKRTFRRALHLFVELNLSFGDAYNATIMEERGLRTVVTFDREYERLPGITRVEL